MENIDNLKNEKEFLNDTEVIRYLEKIYFVQ
jgi:hypothetical protein